MRSFFNNNDLKEIIQEREIIEKRFLLRNMEPKDFEQLLKKYLRGDASKDEEALVEKWYASIEASKDSSGIVDRFLLKRRLRRRLEAHRHKGLAPAPAPVFPGFRDLFPRPIQVSFAVAVVSAMIAAYVFLIRPSDENKDQKIAVDIHGQVITNTGTSSKVVLLADGSRVTLSPGSIVEIADSFDQNSREVYLRKGEGFFDVKRNPSRPFLVYTDKVVTRVLGTSFTVDTRTPDVTVAVKTGRVSVFSNNGSPRTDQDERQAEIVLTPNQQAVYNAEHGKMQLSLVKEPSVIIPAKDLEEMHFESEKVPVILDALAKAYGVTIVYDRTVLSSCTLTTFVNADEDLYKRLGIICEAIGAAYAVEGVNIVISSNGCTSPSE